MKKYLSLSAFLFSFYFSFAQTFQLVKDCNPGNGSSAIYNLYELNGKIYFRASDATSGYEPWVSDGTTAGTKMIKDINPGSSDSYPSTFIPFNGLFYFNADDGIHGT